MDTQLLECGHLPSEHGPHTTGYGVDKDVWFTGPDGKEWHGVQYGENTQICHCHRLAKETRP